MNGIVTNRSKSELGSQAAYGLLDHHHVLLFTSSVYDNWFSRVRERSSRTVVDHSVHLTSPEFEMAACTICALTREECHFTINHQSANILTKVIRADGGVSIDDCHLSTSAALVVTPKTTHDSTKGWKTSAKNFQTLVDKMREADVDKARPEDYKLMWGNEVSKNEDNNSSNLFAYVNETLFQRPVYASFIALLRRKVFHNDVCEKEQPMSGLRRTQIRVMLDAWTSTEVFKLAYEYMHSEGEEHATDFESFKKFLFEFWFGAYSRCQGSAGSSGFEHVFVGEWNKGIVGGHHSWVSYYLAQKRGTIKYHGYYIYAGSIAGTIQYRWENVFKKKGGYLIGTSPAFDFSLFTVCSLIYSGDAKCQYNIDGYPLAVTSFTQPCSSGLCLSTAYPVI
ncbi:hypothetical protein RB195_018185 [Necator americanus]|uniref:EndoU domain-containing protein n=1 Tax=Necator americanus TaxID=51031 RepID=A0ABR1C8L6_NECAM